MGKFKGKRWLAGAMAVMLCCSSFLQTGVFTVSAEAEAEVAQEAMQEPAVVEKTEEELITETVTDPAFAITIEQGTDFEVEKDFTGLGLKDGDRAELKKAAMEDGTTFDSGRPGIYKCVYQITPKEGDSYLVARTITVTDKEPETQAAGDSGSEESGDSEDPDPLPEQPAVAVEVPAEEEKKDADLAEIPVEGEESDVSVDTEVDTEGKPENTTETDIQEDDGFGSEILPEEEFDSELERAEEENTVDPETGLTLGEVLEQAQEQNLNLMEMEEGETASFIATYASTTTDVSVTRGSCYYYSDYDLGSYLTYKYTVSFNNVTATAYCIQPSKSSPGDGVFKITRLGDGKKLAKVCYYGTKASGVNGFFKTEHPDFSAGKQFVITHLAVSYASGSDDAFSGANANGQALAMELYNYCMAQPEIPDVAMAFSNPNVTAYIDGSEQRTEEIKFKADTLQNITMKLPAGVVFYNVDTGEASEGGAKVKVYGGTTFYLSAPLNQATAVAGSWKSTMKGYITKDFSAYKVTTGTDTQNLALVFGEGVDDEKYVDFSVTWLQQATIEIIKNHRSHTFIPTHTVI